MRDALILRTLSSHGAIQPSLRYVEFGCSYVHHAQWKNAFQGDKLKINNLKGEIRGSDV